jgi:hypothetical protein
MGNELLEIEIDILEYAERGDEVPTAKAYHVRIDGERRRIETPCPTGESVLALVGKYPCAFELIEEFSHRENNVVEPHETVDLRKRGLRGFFTAHKEIVTVFFGETKAPYQIERGERTTAAIMALLKDGKTPDGYDLYIEEPGKPPTLLPGNRPVKIHGCEIFHVQAKSGGSS